MIMTTLKLIEFLRRKHPEIYNELIFRNGKVYITVKGVELFIKNVSLKKLADEIDC